MKDTIRLTNQRASILDLLAINDVTGQRVVLQPAGLPGDARECFASVEDHPHVQTMKDARWLRIERPLVRAVLPSADEQGSPTTAPDGLSEAEASAEAPAVGPPLVEDVVESAVPEPSVEPPIEAPAEAPSATEAPTEHRRHKSKR